MSRAVSHSHSHGMLSFQELKRICCIAGSVIPVISSQFLLQIVSTMIVGHVNALSLASAALAISICGVTGFSFLAYGDEQYKKFGMQIYAAIFSLVLMCIPLAIICVNMESILILMGQDPQISHEAGKFTMWLVPMLMSSCACAILQPLVRYLLMQSLTLPMLMSSCATFCIHIPLCWALVYKSGLRNIGAALALSISILLNTAFIGLYIRFSSACAKTRVPISMKLFKGIIEFFHFAFPSAVMFCLELNGGHLSCLSCCLGFYQIENLKRQFFQFVSAPSYHSIPSLSEWGLLPGSSRYYHCGWQHLGAYINLGAFYLCGIPLSAILAFWMQLRAKGLWIGIQIGAFVQTVLLAIITSCINWQQEVSNARKTLFGTQFSEDNGLVREGNNENPFRSVGIHRLIYIF